jgi:hypothetical protein
MSGKFASITADLLARKGGAVPSAIVAKPLLDWTVPPQQYAHVADEPMIQPKVRHHADTPHLHKDDAHYLRKIQVGLSDGDHERLRILSARKETSRQQIVRQALAAYFEKQAQDYGGQCRCLSGAGPCQNGCQSS